MNIERRMLPYFGVRCSMLDVSQFPMTFRNSNRYRNAFSYRGIPNYSYVIDLTPMQRVLSSKRVGESEQI